MKKLILFLVVGQFCLLLDGQIVADHTVVDQYDDIPLEYLNLVKSMLVDVPGESHSAGYSIGQELLELLDDRYQVETYSGTPPASTNQFLRIGSHRWTGERFFFSEGKIAEMKEDISDQNSTGNPFHYMVFAWCYDMTNDNPPGGGEDPVYNVRWAGRSEGSLEGNMRWGLDSEDQDLTGNSVSMDTYLAAIDSYNLFCEENSYPTRWIFSTGPVDEEAHAGTENGFQREIKHDYIRDYVSKDASRVLFDYADILCWNNDGDEYVTDWNDEGSTRPHPQIHPDNMMDYNSSWELVSHVEDGDHIGEVGALRLAKAMWWLLARLSGWNPETTSIEPNTDDMSESGISIQNYSGFIRVYTPEIFDQGTLDLIDINGRKLGSMIIEGITTDVNINSFIQGPIVLIAKKDRHMVSSKVIILP